MSEKAIWEYLKTLKNGGGETTVSVAVGSTTTGAEGTNANVENSGDEVNVILDFTIPRGNTGSKGDKGDTGDAAGFGTPTASVDGNVGTPSVDITASGSDTAKVFNFAFHNLKGVKGDKGDTGDAFHIVKTYASVAAMNADYSGTDVKIGEYVMITSSVEDPDNAKVYIKGSQAYEFVVDMSGATGIKGDKGDTGATGNGIATVTKTSTSGLVDTYTITYTDGTTSNFTVTNGAKGDTGATGNGIANVSLNQDYTLTLTFTDGTTYTTPSIRGQTGATGATGNGISSISKTGTSGLVDTYTITFTDGTTTTFTVTNGAKGDKGDTFTYDDLTPAQKAEIKADLRAYYSKSESRYVTAQADEDTIPIGITGFRSTDILFVDINGLDLTDGEDYTISGTNIVLETPISATGQEVHFLALRAVSITAQDYDALKGDAGVMDSYPISGATPLSAGWLSDEQGGSALTPEANQIYILMADSGDYTENSMFRWNGTAYEPLTSGGSGGEHIELTQAEYDALPQSEKEDPDKVYFITDGTPDYMIVNDSVPVGAIQSYGGSTAPNGWLICDGSAVSRTTYAELFSAIGTTYGSGDGSTTFNVPDLKGRVITGVGTCDGITYELGDKKSAGVPNITGTLRTGWGDSSGGGIILDKCSGAINNLYRDGTAYWARGDVYGDDYHNNSFGFSAQASDSHYGASTTIQPNTTVANYIIKAKELSILHASLQPIVDILYPVGRYIETSDPNYDPNVSLGGTWVQDSKGRVLVAYDEDVTAFNQVGKTGGNKDAVVPYHRHSVAEFDTGGMSANSSHSHKDGTQTNGIAVAQAGSTSAIVSYNANSGRATTSADLSHTHKVGAHHTNYEGTSGNTTDANLQPYTVVYRWHRTA